MKHIKVAHLMTDEVVSVVPSTSFKDVAKLLAAHDITGLPVVDEEERVVGVVSETDLLARQADGGRSSDRRGELTAADVMSCPAVCVHADETAPNAARLMTRRSVERLPVVDEEDRLVGIVTRRDLLRVFLRPDAEIRRRVADDILSDTMDLGENTVTVHVLDGVVTLEGRLERQSQIPVLLRLTEQLDGVVGVADRLTARIDDSGVGLSAHAARRALW
ncbi:CBS domain-containing protein [Streptomyces sp. NPDC054797]